MDIPSTISHVHQALEEVFHTFDLYFDLPTYLRSFKPDPQSWSIDEILEHVTLTAPEDKDYLITMQEGIDDLVRAYFHQTVVIHVPNQVGNYTIYANAIQPVSD